MNATTRFPSCLGTVRRWTFSVGALAALAWALPAGGLAQAPQNPPPAASSATAANAGTKPEDVKFKTGDGVNLVATYYASSAGKDAVPVILLHGFKGNRGEFKDLAVFLQSMGCAVLVPDLRGHGDSTQSDNSSRALNPDLFRKDQFEAMFGPDGDLEKCKTFLIEKNNQGECNIDKLCVIGAQLGASVGLNWAVTDWSWPVLLTGKQGQDVKALVLITPEMSSKGLTPRMALKNEDVRSKLSIMIIVGTMNTKANSDAKAINNFLKPFHPDPPPARIKTDKDLFFVTCNTQLEGTKLLTQPALRVNDAIGQFITARLIDKAYPWRARKS